MSCTNELDARCLASVALGDRRAFAELYDRHAGRMIAMGARILGERRDAEDVLQEVFLQVWRNPGSYDPARGSVRAWLGILMRSRALDRRRSRGARDCVSAAVPTAVSANDDPSRARDRLAVRRALYALPLEQRQVLELTYFEDLSASEIAARMGAPVGTVKSRRAAALQKLRTAFGCRDAGRE